MCEHVTIHTVVSVDYGLEDSDAIQTVTNSVYANEIDAENALLLDVSEEFGNPLEPDESAAIVNDAWNGGYESFGNIIYDLVKYITHYLSTHKVEPVGCNSPELMRVECSNTILPEE